ncbi:hypothetical protein FI667_g7045, partial [Globisporangium splendens]
MNTKFAALALAAFTANAVAAEDCAVPTAELTKLVQTTLVKAGTNYDACKLGVNSAFTLVPISGEPSPEVLSSMCALPVCSVAFKEIFAKATTLLDCTYVNAQTKKSLNIYQFLRDFDASCAKFTPAPTPSTPAPTTKTPGTPAPTTVVPGTPAPTTPTPAPPVTPTPVPKTPEPTLPKPSC